MFTDSDTSDSDFFFFYSCVKSVLVSNMAYFPKAVTIQGCLIGEQNSNNLKRASQISPKNKRASFLVFSVMLMSNPT